MQDRFATWGENGNNENLLLAILFDKKELLAKIHVYQKKALNKDQMKLIKDEWESGKEAELPKPVEIITRSLSEDSILPEEIRIEETGKLRRLQNEWAYFILSNKLWESFLDELEILKTKVKDLTAYDADVFDQSKSLWERLLSQKKDRNISQEKLDSIKEELNGVFDTLKAFRKEKVKQLDHDSIHLKEKFDAKLTELREQFAGENANYRKLFDSLKNVQKEIRETRLRRNHKNDLLKRVSAFFEMVSEKRKSYGSEKINKRLQGLEDVIQKMENSIERDKKDLAYQTRRAENPGVSQLEDQLRQAKINMIEDKINSKEEKLKDILDTYKSLKKKAPEKKAPAAEQDKPKVKKPAKEKPSDNNKVKIDDSTSANTNTDKPKDSES